MKVMTMAGTRPEIIRLARVMAPLDSTEGLDHVLVRTHQNDDHQLNQVFCDELDLRAPDRYLGERVEGEVPRLEPFRFHDYNHLQLRVTCVLSDADTISDDSSILGFPAVTLRDSIERPEALDTGPAGLTGPDPDDVERAVTIAIAESTATSAMPGGHEVGDTSTRVVRFIARPALRHHGWAGIRAERKPSR